MIAAKRVEVGGARNVPRGWVQALVNGYNLKCDDVYNELKKRKRSGKTSVVSTTDATQQPIAVTNNQSQPPIALMSEQTE